MSSFYGKNWLMNEITLKPIGIVCNARLSPDDDHWGNVVSEIRLDKSLPKESLDGLENFSHAETLFYFNQVADEENIPMFRVIHSGNKEWPKVEIFAQRNKDRPNHLGHSGAGISTDVKYFFHPQLD